MHVSGLGSNSSVTCGLGPIGLNDLSPHWPLCALRVTSFEVLLTVMEADEKFPRCSFILTVLKGLVVSAA